MCRKNAERNVFIDIVKIIAIIGVVIIHNCDFSTAVGCSEWNISLFWRSLSGASVPLFLMASGAVMLDEKKELPLKKLYLKNILRILFAMFFWATVYKFYHLFDANEFTFATAVNAVKEALVFNQEFHFYYLHMIIIVYVFLPVTRLIVKHSDKKQLEYLIVLWILLAIVYPTLIRFHPFTLLSGMTVTYGINLTYASIGYGIWGYYLSKYPLSRLASVISAFFGAVSMFALTLCESLDAGVLSEHYLSGNALCALMLATGIFAMAYHTDIRSLKAKSVILWMSKSSFCVYLIHMLVIYILKDNGFDTKFATGLISVPVYAFVVIAICMGVYGILSKIPFVKKWLI